MKYNNWYELNSNMEENPPPQSKPLSKTKIFISRIKRRVLRHVWLTRIGIVAVGILGIYLAILVTSFILGKTVDVSFNNTCA